MNNQAIQYRIYPSLLNSFQRLLDAEIDAEDFSNIDSETGDYRRLPDDIATEREQELLDLINRVKKEPIEIADRGTAFNEIIDCIVLNEPCKREDITIRHIKEEHETRLKLVCDGIDNIGDKYTEYNIDTPESIEAKINGFTFLFDVHTCKETAKYFANTIPQHLCQATLETDYGTVQLYGYADYIFHDKVVDLKTCNRYDFGKYASNWQKDVYPYCLIESGDMSECSSFEFYIVQMKGGTNRTHILSGTDYREVYTYNHEQSKVRLKQICERLIEWLNAHRSQITNDKIFNN